MGLIVAMLVTEILILNVTNMTKMKKIIVVVMMMGMLVIIQLFFMKAEKQQVCVLQYSIIRLTI